MEYLSILLLSCLITEVTDGDKVQLNNKTIYISPYEYKKKIRTHFKTNQDARNYNNSSSTEVKKKL